LVVLSAGLFAIVFAVLRGNALGWGSPTVVGCLVAGALFLALFVLVEHRTARPMLDLSLFANRTFTGASIVVGVLGGATFGSFVYLSLFLLDVQGRSPVETGLVLAPLAVVSFVVSLVAGRFNERLPLRATLVAGLVVVAAGNALLWHRTRCELPAPAARARGHRRRRGTGQPAGHVRAPRRDVARPRRPGQRPQQHSPAGRPGDRDRRARRARRTLPACLGAGDAYALAFTDALGDVYIIAAVATLLTAAAALVLHPHRRPVVRAAPLLRRRRRASPPS
jgi:hypothetical protein